MTYSDSYNIRTTSVKFNDVADAIDGVITRSNGGTTTGTSSAYIVTPTPAWNAYYTNSFIIIIPHVTNSAGATINISGLGAKNITRGGSNITAGSMPAGFPVFLSYTGTTFEAGFVTAGAVAADGSVPMTADLNFGGYKPINIAAGTASVPAICAGNDVDTGIFSPAANTWAVSTGTLERIRVDSNGQLGIGTSSPAATVDVQSTATEVRVSRFSNDSTGSVLGLYKSKGTNVGVNTLISNGDTVGSIEFRGADGTDYDACARISAAIDATPSNGTDMPGRLMFFTTPDASATPTERMRIDKDGNVGIGTTAPTRNINVEKNQDATTSIGIYNSNAGSNGRASLVLGTNEGEATAGVVLNSGTNTALGGGSSFNIYNSMANGPLCFRTTGVERMRITGAGEVLVGGTTDNGAYNLQCNGTGVWGAGAYVNGSDSRLKDDIAPIDNTLDIVKSLNPVVFRYKETFSSDTNLQPGFIAQELQTALSNCSYKDGVVMQGTEYLNVAYQALIPVLTKAIQELNAKVEILESEIATLKSQGA